LKTIVIHEHFVPTSTNTLFQNTPISTNTLFYTPVVLFLLFISRSKAGPSVDNGDEE
jgi:hypothetical protein